MRCFAALLVGAVLVTVGYAEESADEEGFQPLFDGETLNGWNGATKGYSVEDGVMACRRGHGGKLLTDAEFGDFVLRFEFQLTPGANNGLGIRAPKQGNAAYVGMELQIIDNTADKYKNLKAYQYHGSVYGVAPAKRGHLRPVGEWNQQEVRCVGRQVTVILNGHTIVDVDLDEVAPEGKTIDGHAHPGLARTKGHIGFLGHGDPLAFRNIRIREISPKPPGE